ncbi:MAG: carbamoyltransferase HypF [Myxococcales bacterium]
MPRRLAIAVQGVVQGVGFRPFVYRIALEHQLAGWVCNRTDGVRIEVQGAQASLDAFVHDLKTKLPPQASIERLQIEEMAAEPGSEFVILGSDAESAPRPSIPADGNVCADCRAELSTPSERRFGYPFTNCTNCGPRYSIIEALPYDRPRTSMKGFPLCAECEAEYRNPLDRRFHAQPVACPRCGPQVELLSRDGASLARGDAAIEAAARAVLDGKVLALKGLGGFQLLVDATRTSPVELLRQRKHREAKPFAVMFPTLESLRACCLVSDDEQKLLESPQAPIVLVRKRRDGVPLAEPVAPGNPRLGVMLPYTPLHIVLMAAIARPIVCTSGNLSDEPMCIDNAEALARLGPIADLFLVHDRPIVRPIDDSVARVGARGIELLRRARGYAPLPIRLAEKLPTVVALGGHLKCTAALSLGDQAIVSQHLGDLDSAEGAALLERTVRDLVRFFEARPAAVACDQHPNYTSTRIAERLASEWGVPLVRVQHHHAHAAAVATEHGIDSEVLGISWDGTGWGPDGTIWGGEALACSGSDYRRVARLRPFPLPGGDLAAKEPRRAALGLLFALSPSLARDRAGRWFAPDEARALIAMLERGFNTTLTSSAGRLFDAASAIAGVRDRNGFEGQAAMELEFAAEGIEAEPYPLPLIDEGEIATADWRPLAEALLADVDSSVPTGVIGARFHEALAGLVVAIARRAALPRVVLAGGCFQNERLARSATKSLQAAGFELLAPRLLPANDGALSFGQLYVAGRALEPRP